MEPRWLAFSLAFTLAGCVLPFGSAAPQPATTAGKGAFMLGVRSELPTVDLLETQEAQDADYQLTPFPVTSVEIGYGVHERLDVEAALDTVLYIVVPAPLGGALGLRAQLFRTDTIAVAAAARLGWVGSSSSGEDNDGNQTGRSVSATYGTGSLTAQINPDGWFSPGLAMSYYGASVKDDPADAAAERFFTNLGTATLYIDLTGNDRSHLGPFANVIIIDAGELGTDAVVTGGLFFYLQFGGEPTAAPMPMAPQTGPPGSAP